MVAMSRPLSGLHVVECASFVAGPTGGMTLAQLGAKSRQLSDLEREHSDRTAELVAEVHRYLYSPWQLLSFLGPIQTQNKN